MKHIQGTEAIVDNVTNLMHNGQSVSLVGGTALSRAHLLDRLCDRVWLNNGPKVLIKVDCSKLIESAPHQTLRVFIQELSPCVDQQSAAMVAALERANSQPTYLNFDGLIRQFDRQGKAIFLMLSEFSFLSQNPQLDLNFFNALRATASRYNLVFVTTSDRPLIELTFLNRTEDILTSPFFNIFAIVDLHEYR